jgi:O-antigen ligase
MTTVTSDVRADTRKNTAVVLVVLASIAIGLPTLLAFNLPPSSTFLNQAAALIGWGAFLTVLASSFVQSTFFRSSGLSALQASFGILLLAAFTSPFWTGLPWSLSLSSAGLIFAAALTTQAAAAAQREGLALPAFRAFCIGLVVAGVLSSIVGILQVFAPGLPDGNWIARTYMDGRAVGNMRQPNHLSSLLVWSIIAAVWLGEAQVLKRGVVWVLTLLFVFVVMLSASRTGTVSIIALAAWGVFDKRLSRSARALLLVSLAFYFAALFGTSAWAEQSHHAFGAEARFTTKGDISSSRFGIWRNTLSLIGMHPWLGVGFGEFNFAWTLTPFPGRPVAFFDHTHNLVLQFAVELGIPLALLVLGLMAWALFRALQGALAGRSNPDAAQAMLRPAAFAMVALILVHSMLEYPLWYAYYLLPAAFAFGLCLADPGEPRAPVSAAPGAPRAIVVAAIVLMVGGIASVADYYRVVVIFDPPETTSSLAQRIADGRRSVFFAHHADYAAATTTEHPSDAAFAFIRAPHYLLDARLLQAWAKALDEAGDTQQARYVAQRLREFRNEQSEPFFAPCDDEPTADKPLPFQCVEPTRQFKYEDFR